MSRKCHSDHLNDSSIGCWLVKEPALTAPVAVTTARLCLKGPAAGPAGTERDISPTAMSKRVFALILWAI